MKNSDISDAREKLKSLQAIIGYNFNDENLLFTSLVHKSASEAELLTAPYNAQILEFLGDKVLSYVLAKYLFTKYIDKDEGALSKLIAMLGKASYQNMVAKNLHLDEYIYMEANLRLNLDKTSILSDHLEALIAAIYLDSDIDVAEKFILDKYLKDANMLLDANNDFLNYRNILIEYAQKHGLDLIFTLVKEYGPDNDKSFEYKVELDGHKAIATAKTKKAAKQMASKKLAIEMNLIE